MCIRDSQGIVKMVFSFVGYKTKEVKYTQQAVLNIKLQEELTALDEVVITAKGVISGVSVRI